MPTELIEFARHFASAPAYRSHDDSLVIVARDRASPSLVGRKTKKAPDSSGAFCYLGPVTVVVLAEVSLAISWGVNSTGRNLPAANSFV